MLFHWIGHPSFGADEQLMAVLYDMGIATKRQLLIVTGWTENQLKWYLQRIRKRETEEQKYLNSYPLRFKYMGDTRGYSLNKAGIRYVREMMQSDNMYVKEAPVAQIRHYLGINEILIRLIEAGVQREDIVWLSTAEATDYLSRLLEAHGEKIDRRRLIRPDARAVINKTAFWIEFDNSTERTRKLEGKFHEYVQALTLVRNQDPVVWVAVNRNRKEYLANQWEAVKKVNYEGRVDIPEMYFFVEGEELSFLESRSGLVTS